MAVIGVLAIALSKLIAHPRGFDTSCHLWRIANAQPQLCLPLANTLAQMTDPSDRPTFAIKSGTPKQEG